MDKSPKPGDTNEDRVISTALGGIRPQLNNGSVTRHIERNTIECATGQHEDVSLSLSQEGSRESVVVSPTYNSESSGRMSCSRRVTSSRPSRRMLTDEAPGISNRFTQKRKQLLYSDSEGSLSRKRDKAKHAAERWNRALQQLDLKCENLGGKREHTQSEEECCLIILAIKFTIKWMLRKTPETLLNWTSVEQAVARDFKVDQGFVNELRVGLLEHDRVAVRSVNKRGQAAAQMYKSSSKLNGEDLEELRRYIRSKDELKQGITPTNEELRDWVQNRFNKEVSRSSIQRYLAKIKIQYKPEKEVSTSTGARNNQPNEEKKEPFTSAGARKDKPNEEKDDQEDDSNRCVVSEHNNEGETKWIKTATPTGVQQVIFQGGATELGTSHQGICLTTEADGYHRAVRGEGVSGPATNNAESSLSVCPTVQTMEDPYQRGATCHPDIDQGALLCGHRHGAETPPSPTPLLLDPDVVHALAQLGQPTDDDTLLMTIQSELLDKRS